MPWDMDDEVEGGRKKVWKKWLDGFLGANLTSGFILLMALQWVVIMEVIFCTEIKFVETFWQNRVLYYYNYMKF